ncbi:MAG: hypothetical protein GKR94_11360 [Gammaproteobacteria bacterium]|nr:hypothetical protein [Gammaproteobacteria bacterium]
MTAHYFVEPTDTLFLRGNSEFGEAGQHGQSVVPPAPAVFAGAFRSAMLAHQDGALAAFVRTGRTGDAKLDQVLGVLDPATGQVSKPGSFAVSSTCMAQLHGRELSRFYIPPADLVRLADGPVDAPPTLRTTLRTIVPRALSPLECNSSALPLTASLRAPAPAKPVTGWYLREQGWRQHLAGSRPDARSHVVAASALHALDPRLGIGLDAGAGATAKGLIYTTEGHSFVSELDALGNTSSSGFLVGLDGIEGQLPDSGQLRLGGEGRSARFTRVPAPTPDAAPAVESRSRLRLLLLTPGLFAKGWVPDGIELKNGVYWLDLGTAKARLACAALRRSEVVSGWDLFRRCPKPAQRCVPAGSVYWFDQVEGDMAEFARWAACRLSDAALGPERRAEGFNRAVVSAWADAHGG